MVQSIFDKPYDEEFARICIMSCFPDFGLQLELNPSDPPDIIESSKNVGIEVTRAMTKNDGQLSSSFNKYVGQSKKSVPENLRKKLDKNGRGLVYNPDQIVIGVGYGATSDLYKIIKRAIEKKTKRLNGSNYPPFECDMLFVFNSGGFCFEDGLKTMFDELQNDFSSCSRTFDAIFIYCDHEIYFMDLATKEMFTRFITDDKSDIIKKNTIANLGRKLPKKALT